jgi:pimeloyl-ACP methyl ester carboxylesterase
MASLDEWFAGGERVRVDLRSGAFEVFCRLEGEGPWLTFLHGFPTCSWDWVRIAGALRPHFRLLFFDFLGFGDSDKPAGHAYSLFEQADLTEALWRRFGVARTGLIAHDYGDTVALELLARQKERRLATRVERALLMNGGVYVDLQRPVLAQRLLRKPILGPLVSRLLGEAAFAQQFSKIFAPAHPISREEIREHWRAVNRRDGKRNYHRLIAYLGERRRHQARWEAALEDAGVPLFIAWGPEDPVSGRPILDRIRARVRAAAVAELAGVGHYPQLEVPEAVVAEIRRAFG